MAEQEVVAERPAGEGRSHNFSTRRFDWLCHVESRSIERLAWLFWNGYAGRLIAAGWTETQVAGHLGEAERMLEELGAEAFNLGTRLAEQHNGLNR